MSANPRGILSLLEHCGEDNIEVQFLHQSVTDVTRQSDCTSVTFVTAHDKIDPSDLMPFAKPRKVGLVVWVDADRVEGWRKLL